MPSAGRTGRLCYSALAALLFHIGLASSLFPMLPHWHFRPQLLPDGASPRRPASLFATAPRQPLRHSAPAIIFQMALRRGALAIIFQMALRRGTLASTCPGQQLHLGAWPVFTAPRQQQTSFGGEKHSGLASNLAHLGRIC